MKKIYVIVMLFLIASFTSCNENYSNGERIGMVTQFSKVGNIWKSWEGHLNLTQTGNNSSLAFDFSLDNDQNNENLIKVIDSAATYGFKVKLKYHNVMGKNWLSNRGNTDFFVTECEVLDRNMVHNNINTNIGKVIDTIYVVIDKSK